MNELFFGITTANKSKILKALESDTLTFSLGAKILSSIKMNSNIAIVLEGQLKIIRDDSTGNNLVIDVLEEGAIFGSIVSSINSNNYEIIAVENSKILLIDFDHVIDKTINITGYNQFLKNLLSIINSKILNYNDRILILTNKTIRNKLLEYFRLMYKRNNSKILYIPYSYTYLADYLAVDRCAMSRELKHLKDEGLIEITGKKIKLLYFSNFI